MASRFNTLRYGNLSDVLKELESGPCDEGELRAVITNLIGELKSQDRRIDELEVRDGNAQ